MQQEQGLSAKLEKPMTGLHWFVMIELEALPVARMHRMTLEAHKPGVREM